MRTALHGRTGRGIRVLGQLGELYVLASVLAVSIEVPVEVGTVPFAALTALATLLVAALAVLPLIVPILGREDQALFDAGLLAVLALLLLFAPFFELGLYAGL
jgi:hypothetical protein